MKSPTKPSATAIRRARSQIEKALATLPEAGLVDISSHASIEVRGKRFGWLLIDHHGDQRIAINVKCSAILAGALQDAAPTHFHIPKYVGHRGWIGLWLDVPKLDPRLLEDALSDGYRQVAPKSLLSTLKG